MVYRTEINDVLVMVNALGYCSEGQEVIALALPYHCKLGYSMTKTPWYRWHIKASCTLISFP